MTTVSETQTPWDIFQGGIRREAAKLDPASDLLLVDTTIAAVAVVDLIADRDLRKLLHRFAMEQIQKVLRERSRCVEESARRLATPQQTLPVAGIEDRYQSVYDNPLEYTLFSGSTRSTFRTWCKRDGRSFDEWFQRLVDACPTEQEREYAYAAFVRGYRTRAEREIEHNLHRKINGLFEEFAAKIRLEVTEDLLNTVFSIGDGTRVTWRDATVEQHRERVGFLGKMVVGTAETAGMHLAAINLIEEQGVSTLGEVEP